MWPWFSSAVPHALRAFDIEAKALAAMDPDQVFLVNTNDSYEGEIEHTDAFVPFNALGDLVDSLSSDKDTPIVVYCTGGARNVRAARGLV